MVRSIIRLSLLVGVALWAACSTGTYVGGDCGNTDDCRLDDNYIGGSTCDGTKCVCDPGYEACCPNGDDALCIVKTDNRCRPEAECHPPPLECVTAADCPAAPDSRCADVTCTAGKCGLSVHFPGPELASQVPGDCRTRFCDQYGVVIAQDDPGDAPLDANPCTVDTCKGGKPVNETLADKQPCLETDSGVCLAGECVECSDVMGIVCPNPKQICDYIYCVPPTCVNLMHDGDESATDCGGSCRPCIEAYTCNSSSDCLSKVCKGGVCVASSHSDGVRNDGETGVDCGCQACLKKCHDEEGCTSSAHCQSGVCYAGICQKPTCFDGTQNGGEAGEDCGAPCEVSCPTEG